MIIDCQSCAMRDIACGNCVVTHFLALAEVREIAAPEAKALTVLHGAGLVPPLQMEPVEARTQRLTGLG